MKVEKIEFLDPSPIGAELERYIKALEPCKDLPHNKSFSLPSSFQVGKLQAIAPENIAIIDHREIIEVRKLPEGIAANIFYLFINSNEKNVTKKERKQIARKFVDPEETFKKFIANYFEKTFPETSLAYALQKRHAILWSTIQRGLASVAAFRGQSELLDNICHKFEEAQLLQVFLNHGLDTRAKVFLVNFSKI